MDRATGEEPVKRDNWAKARTHLANERTLSSYIRTALAFLVLGAFLLKFVPTSYSFILALIAILVGATLLILGFVRFYKYKRKINQE